jgi:hypothetical protein
MPRLKKIKFYAFDQARGIIIEIEGTPIVIPGFEQFHFIYHRWPDRKFNRISEFLTSVMIVEDQRTKADAIGKARKLLTMLGIEGLKENMKIARDEILGGSYLNEYKGQCELLF